MDEDADSANSSEDEAGGATWLESHLLVPALLLGLAGVVGLYLSIRLMSHVILALLIAGGVGVVWAGTIMYARREQRKTPQLIAFWTACALLLFGFAAAFPPVWFWVLAWLESGRSPVPASLVFGILSVLMGCGAIWVGIVLPRGGSVMSQDANGQAQIRRWTRPEVWLCRATWLACGVAFICLGVLAPQYSQGTIIAIPVHGPLLDQLISIAIVVGFAAFILLLLAWIAVAQHADKKWQAEHQVGQDPQVDTDSGQPIAPPS